MSIERVLDRALTGHPNGEPEIESLVAVARELERTFAIEPTSWSRERAMFVAGAGARRRGISIGRFLAPALAILLVVLVGVAGRFALPGDALYPVRQVLQNMGLAPTVWAAADEDIAQATRLVVAAEAALDVQDLLAAEEAASAAIARLADALEDLEGLAGDGKIQRVLEITALQERAEEVIAAVEGAEDIPDPSDRGPEPGTVEGRKQDDEDDDDGGDGDDDADTDDRDANTGNATDGGDGLDETTIDGDDGEPFDGDDDGGGGGGDTDTLNGDGTVGDEELDD